MMGGDVLAKTCDAGPAGDKPHQCRVIGTGRITIDHGLAFDHLQQTGVPDLSPRCVPGEEAAKSKFRRKVAVPSAPHTPGSRHGERSKAGEPVSVTPRPSRCRHPADRDDGVTHHGTQPRCHGRQRTPEASSADIEASCRQGLVAAVAHGAIVNVRRVPAAGCGSGRVPGEGSRTRESCNRSPALGSLEALWCRPGVGGVRWRTRDPPRPGAIAA